MEFNDQMDVNFSKTNSENQRSFNGPLGDYGGSRFASIFNENKLKSADDDDDYKLLMESILKSGGKTIVDRLNVGERGFAVDYTPSTSLNTSSTSINSLNSNATNSYAYVPYVSTSTVNSMDNITNTANGSFDSFVRSINWSNSNNNGSSFRDSMRPSSSIASERSIFSDFNSFNIDWSFGGSSSFRSPVVQPTYVESLQALSISSSQRTQPFVGRGMSKYFNYQNTVSSELGRALSNISSILDPRSVGIRQRPVGSQGTFKSINAFRKNIPKKKKKKNNEHFALISLRDKEFDDAVDYLKETLVSLYKDQIPPVYFNVRGRFIEFNSKGIAPEHIMDVCKRRSDIFNVVTNGSLNETYIYLVEPPSWFNNWVDRNDMNDTYPQDMWDQFITFLEGVASGRDNTIFFPGSIYGMSRVLQRLNLPFLANMTLGTICHIVQLAIRVRKLIVYDVKTLKPSPSFFSIRPTQG
ncbi:hypothetical protein BEWA_007990 [Theileria equi strain WA]|uniref:Uncharacterized protein n=1 Tax=Theileria equi strain WA TaxID=1537102 RepID=L0B0R8_THEEQ|nr:hypothetical protein BEWA_007990 [Theileria equi strain WA]AFZ81390.1 hypothetical protein BEWA_007990 [Theileria equi strain WA]|eukprot:XP_004831056.1 hypothetical protein BEWA_007990 [Theileria equi strain WA]